MHYIKHMNKNIINNYLPSDGEVAPKCPSLKTALIHLCWTADY